MMANSNENCQLLAQPLESQLLRHEAPGVDPSKSQVAPNIDASLHGIEVPTEHSLKIQFTQLDLLVDRPDIVVLTLQPGWNDSFTTRGNPALIISPQAVTESTVIRGMRIEAGTVRIE